MEPRFPGIYTIEVITLETFSICRSGTEEEVTELTIILQNIVDILNDHKHHQKPRNVALEIRQSALSTLTKSKFNQVTVC